MGRAIHDLCCPMSVTRSQRRSVAITNDIARHRRRQTSQAQTTFNSRSRKCHGKHLRRKSKSCNGIMCACQRAPIWTANLAFCLLSTARWSNQPYILTYSCSLVAEPSHCVQRRWPFWLEWVPRAVWRHATQYNRRNCSACKLAYRLGRVKAKKVKEVYSC